MAEDHLTGWLVWSRPPAQLLDEIVVTDRDGRTIASRPLPYGTAGTRAWDVTLRQLGFQRLGAWMSGSGGYTCRVEPRPLRSAAA